MKVLAVLLACIVACAFACPPPFNNWDFYGNETHTTSDLIRNALDGQTTGWTEAVKDFSNPMEPWPAKDGIATIYYCYESESTKRDLEIHFTAAISLWTAVIGTPNAQTGHNLDVREVPYTPTTGTADNYCYSSPGNWNTKIQGGTLVIMKVDPNRLEDASASLGYTPTGANDRHQLRVSPENIQNGNEDVIIAHELGHVFGLYHEHQREDRDKYLGFECSNLEGYDDAKRYIESEGRHTIEEVCDSSSLSYLYNWNAAAWSKHDYIDPATGVQWRLGTGGLLPDMSSIMLYSSFHGIAPGKNRWDFNMVPLVQWTVPGDDNHERTKDNSVIYPPITKPSDGDRDGIKYIYPWQG